ncbi:MAG TPA: tetratricopeptide repeat protein [Oculatellaceae cyanobacterium]|jgi:tetratricopeptide (TPR) repeat protein
MKKQITFAIAPALVALSIGLACAEQKPPVTPQKTMPQKAVQTQSMESHKQLKNPMLLSMPSKAHPLMVEGQMALIERKYPAAIQAFQKLLSMEPNNVQALNGLCIAYLNHGNYEEALKVINKAIALDPVNTRLLYTKAQVLDVQNKPVEAVETYLTFACMAPNDGAALAAQGRAAELYEKVEPQLNPASAKYIQGLRMLSLHQPEQAIPLFEQCKSLDPNNHQVAVMQGCAYLEAGQPEKAIDCFQNVLKTQGNSPLAYYHLSSGYEMRGERKNAQDAFRKFMQVAPQSETATRMNRMLEISSQ